MITRAIRGFGYKTFKSDRFRVVSEAGGFFDLTSIFKYTRRDKYIKFKGEENGKVIIYFRISNRRTS